MARFENKLMLFVAAAALVTAMSASFLADEIKLFSHKEHIESGAECAGCHNASPAKGELPTLNEEACADCHEEVPAPRKLGAKRRPLQIAFKHKLHVDVGQCADCHAATADETLKDGEPAMAVEKCFACHEENGIEIAAADCAKCHGSDKSKEKPADHGANWTTVHPQQAKTAQHKAHGRQCAQCHGKTPCATCHQAQKPVSHKLHIEERGAECDMCHERRAEEQLPGVKTSGCIDCHDGTPQMDTIAEARARKLDISFPHAIHEDAAECADCHQATIDGTQRADRPVITQQDCQSCHAENGVAVPARQCAKCHGVAQSKVKPKSHKTSWPIRHGKQAEWRAFSAHGEDCYLCHKKRECVTCHLTRRPRDHNGLWRMRMHGVAAEWNRERCKTCHETGSCIACHRRTKPLYHRGAWRAVHGLAAQVKDKDRCMTCHNQGWCTRCHTGGQ
jgi:hypothetical protein